MNRKKIENNILMLLAVIVFLIPAYMVKEHLQKSNKLDNLDEANYVGRETCIECHNTQYHLWLGSHHDKAMEHATDSTVLGDFNDVSFISKNGTIHKFYRKEGKFFVFTDGDAGVMEEYEVKYTFGFTPLQQYLVEFPGGRLQTLPLTWNSLNNNWYHMADSVYKLENLNHENWLQWTNQAQNWNSMCADCHSTNLVKGYDVETDTYNTTWSEIDVSCEACHGPASKHLDWANLPEYSRSTTNNLGLVVNTSNLNNKEYVDQCARCHSRRAAITDYHPNNGSILNHLIPNLPTEPHYYIDGQILDEDYVYGSFTQSKMYMHDVKCNDCHDVHSGKRLFEDNRLCLQCHVSETYDTPKHHFHKAKGELGQAVTSVAGVRFEVGEGTKCINCHMHAQFFMGVDYRNDHSFRIPRPDLSEKLGTPNACNQCHADKTNNWAQSFIEKWYGNSRHFQYGEAFAKAKEGKIEGLEQLKDIYTNDLYPDIVRSTAIQFAGTYYQSNSKLILYEALLHTNPLVRYTAVHNLVLDTPESILNILPLLNDETKAVRIECAGSLMGVPGEQIPEKYKQNLAKATNEYVESLKYNADFPIGKFNLANYYYNNKQYAEAEKFYLAALKQDAELHTIKINLAYLYNAMGKPEKAAVLFKSYLNTNPNDGEILFTYGLLLAELTRYPEAMQYLLKAAENSPENARIFYNIGQMYVFFNDNANAEKYLLLAIEKDDSNQAYYFGLLNFYREKSFSIKVKNLAKEMLNKFPTMENRAQIEALL